jgi:hypothetical protein
MKEINIPEEVIAGKIYEIRGHKVMLDNDLADMYGVETRRLNEQVKRNNDRFPLDFMFQLKESEWEILKSQNATSSWGGRRKLPNAFTEHGVLMLSSVLNSEKAIAVNIHIMRVYTRLRELLSTNKEVIVEIQKLKNTITSNSDNIDVIFKYLKQLEQAKQRELDQQLRKKIGFNSKD